MARWINDWTDERRGMDSGWLVCLGGSMNWKEEGANVEFKFCFWVLGWHRDGSSVPLTWQQSNVLLAVRFWNAGKSPCFRLSLRVGIHAPLVNWRAETFCVIFPSSQGTPRKNDGVPKTPWRRQSWCLCFSVLLDHPFVGLKKGTDCVGLKHSFKSRLHVWEWRKGLI